MENVIDLVQIALAALLRAEAALLGGGQTIPRESQKIDPTVCNQRPPDIFAIIGSDALRAATTPRGRALQEPLTIQVQNKYLKKPNRSSPSPFLDSFVFFVNHLIKAELQDDYSEDVFSFNLPKVQSDDSSVEQVDLQVNFGLFNQNLVIKLQPWGLSPNILNLMKSQPLNSEEVIFNPKNQELLITRDNVLIPLGKDQYEFEIKGDFSRKTIEDILKLIDLANSVNRSSLTTRLEKTGEFTQLLSQISSSLQGAGHNGLFVAGLRSIGRSTFWYKNFVDLINYKLIPLDTRTSSSMPFKPKLSKQLLEKFKLSEEDFWSQVNPKDGPDSSRFFQGQVSFRLLALAIALIGDLLVFRESSTYLKVLLNSFFGIDLSTNFNEFINDPYFEVLIEKLLELQTESVFSVSNLGKEFKKEPENWSQEEISELQSPAEDSRVFLFQDGSLNDSINTQLTLLSKTSIAQTSSSLLRLF